METVKATRYHYKELRRGKIDSQIEPYPLLRSYNGKEQMHCVSPHHGRSFLVGMTTEKKYIITKGNGLSYSQYDYLHSAEFGDHAWGLLLKKDAIRDFDIGMQISQLGIKTNVMNYVLELDTKIRLSTGHLVTPVLLQYTLDCPYRICDAAYMTKEDVARYVNEWERMNSWGCEKPYLIAANVLIKNLRILHSNSILHNAIHFQNYTWALELLDFELACSPKYPYDKEEEKDKVKDLFSREAIQTYEVINHIAWCLSEKPDYRAIERIFKENGFDLSDMR